MAFLNTTLKEIIQRGSEIFGVLDLPEKFWPCPGQYLSCQRVGDAMGILPFNLFSVLGQGDELRVGPIPKDWQPGDDLVCTSPRGHGFNLPDSARRVGLIPFQVSPFILLSLAADTLSRDGAVVLFADSALPADMLAGMLPQVEVLTLDALAESPAWPDYLAVDLERSAIGPFLDHYKFPWAQCEGEVLVRTPMPCQGVGDCSVCAVHTRRGWRLACVDGPVFPMAEVFNVA